MGLPERYTSYFLFLLSFCFSGNAWGKTDMFRCMWREDPATSMVIAWNQISGTDPVLYFDQFDGGTNPELYGNSHRPDRFSTYRGMNSNFVRLTNLRPGTVYYFVIKDSDSVSRRLSFRTAPDNAYERLSIVAGGDSRNFRDARRRANMMVAKLRPHCVMFGGDMTGGDTDQEWREWFDDWQYTISDEGRLTPIIATRGNHEYSNTTIIELFDVPSNNVYYDLTIGGDLLQVFTLNSLIAPGGNQKNWLEGKLSQSPCIWKMAQYHYGMRPHTLRKAERNEQMVHWAGLFYDYGVNLVVESDAHVVKTTWPIKPSRSAGSEEGFIRDDENGTVYVGEGCWGAPLRRNNDDKSWTRNSGSFNQFKWIFLDQDKIEVRTIKTDNAESVASVSPYDIFSPPAGIDIWNPSHGSVLIIPRQYHLPKDMQVAMAVPTSADSWTASTNKVIGSTAKNGSPKTTTTAKVSKLEVLDFLAEIVDGSASIQWNTKQEFFPGLVYELQRSANGKDFMTIAEVMAQGNGGGKYLIKDAASQKYQAEALAYRLRFVANGETYVFDAAKRIENPDQWKDFPELNPDQQSAQLKIKYQLAEPGAVNISLLDPENKIVSVDNYPHQKSGNYLKTLDMGIFSRGRYLLVIMVNEEVVEQYQVVWN